MSQAEKWATATLRIHSVVLNPEAISNALRTPPTNLALRGELMSPRNPKSSKRERHLWALESSLGAESSLEDQIENMIEFIEKNLIIIKRLIKECEIDLFCGYSSSTGQGGICLEASIIKRLSAVPIDLVFDIYTIRD